MTNTNDRTNAMVRKLAIGLIVGAIALPAAAHVTDEPDMPRIVAYDCTAIAGDYNAGGKRVVSISVIDAKVMFTLKGSASVTGECIAPLIADATYYPQVRARFDASFGSKMTAGDCCTLHLKGDKLIFDQAKTAWQRRGQ